MTTASASLRRISVTGPESTGKSELSEKLAKHFRTIWVPEYAREYLENMGHPYKEDDILKIAQGQLKKEEEAVRYSKHLLFCDTDFIVTKIWSEFKYGRCHPWILGQVEKHAYDLYLLCNIDLPWAEDPLREHPRRREELFQLYYRELTVRNLPFKIISGTGDARTSERNFSRGRSVKYTSVIMDSSKGKIQEINEKRMKILYLPRWYPNRYDPMPGLFIERHARSVSPFCDVAVLYVHTDPILRDKHYEIIKSRDKELYQIKVYFRQSRSRIPGMAQAINSWRFLKSHMKGYLEIKTDFGKPDLVHVNVLTRLGLIAFIYKIFTGTPFVITEHWTRYLPMTNTYHGFLRKLFTKWVARNASAILPVTENLKNAMISQGLKNRNYHVIPNVVDISRFTPRTGTTGNNRKKILHVSCFEDGQKNISGMLRVFKRLADTRQDWECRMVGDGIHFNKLVGLADELGIRDSYVFFEGLKENEELIRIMQDADFEVMFSRFENLPVVILEGYACGVPVLSTNVGGISEHMNEELGILIPSEDEEALFDQLNYMLDHQGHFDKARIRKYAEEHFSNDVIGRSIFSIYQEILGA